MTDRAQAAREHFDRPGLAALWRALRDRLERAQGPVRRVRLSGLSREEREALADLLGWKRLPGETATVSVDQLDAILLDSPAGLDSTAVVAAIGGPLRNRVAERRADNSARAELWQWLSHHPVVRAEPALDAWVDYVKSNGLIDSSVPVTRAMLEGVLTVLESLPGGGEPLPEFAERVCGHTHALDDGRRLSTYVLRAVACLHDEPAPTSAVERRALWQRAGLECDTLSTSVLVAGLRPAGDGTLARTTRLWARAGHATRLTLAQLRTEAVTGDRLPLVRVVENPSVVAVALGKLGTTCPPLVCTSGWPNVAVIELLRQLSLNGTTLHCHADLDGAGVRIAAYMSAKTGAWPWRMTAADYLQAVPLQGPDVGRVPEAPWDSALAPALRAHGIAVSEERVIQQLVSDLAGP